MSTTSLFSVVIDTNVVFEGLTKQGGAAGLVIDAWLAGLLEVCVSNPLAYETKMFYLVNSQNLVGKLFSLFWAHCSAVLNSRQFATLGDQLHRMQEMT